MITYLCGHLDTPPQISPERFGKAINCPACEKELEAMRGLPRLQNRDPWRSYLASNYRDFICKDVIRQNPQLPRHLVWKVASLEENCGWWLNRRQKDLPSIEILREIIQRHPKEAKTLKVKVKP